MHVRLSSFTVIIISSYTLFYTKLDYPCRPKKVPRLQGSHRVWNCLDFPKSLEFSGFVWVCLYFLNLMTIVSGFVWNFSHPPFEKIFSWLFSSPNKYISWSKILHSRPFQEVKIQNFLQPWCYAKTIGVINMARHGHGPD